MLTGGNDEAQVRCVLILAKFVCNRGAKQSHESVDSRFYTEHLSLRANDSLELRGFDAMCIKFFRCSEI